MRLPIITFGLIMAVALLALFVAKPSPTHAHENVGEEDNCGAYVCESMSGNTVNVSRAPGSGYSSVVRITSLRDTTEETFGVDACTEDNCNWEDQRGRIYARSLPYQCDADEDEIGVYVVYEKWRSVSSFHNHSNDGERNSSNELGSTT